MKGAVWLQSWTSSSSTASTSSTTWLQLLCGCRSGTRPPASIAVPVAIRSGEAEPAASASAVSASGVGVQCPLRAVSGARASVTISGSGPLGSGTRSAAARCA